VLQIRHWAVAWHRSLLIAAASAVAIGAMLAPLPAQAAMWPVPGAGGPYRAVPPEPYLHGRFVSTAQLSAQLATCEQRMQRTQQQPGRHVPTVVIVGASFTAGVGPGNLDGSWAALLARHLGWDAVVYGDPGAGYVRPGIHRRGPISREISQVNLPELNPALVIVQAGHNDMGVPAQLEQQRVQQVIAQIRAEVPDAGIALITVFVGRLHRPAAYQTDHTIVAAARAADPAVIIMDPLAGKWKFARVRDGLHPTAAGSRWIAAEVSQILEGRGVQPVLAPRGAGAAPGSRPKNIVCDFGIQVPPAVRALPVIQIPSALR
jgi:lysophospholipase L1-like esterase